MVYIEFFDEKELLDNLCSCFVRIPDKVYFIGNNKDKMETHIERYSKILSDRGGNVEMVPLSVNRNSLSALVECMSGIVETEEDCIFDLTGGEDLCLVAMGIVFEKYRETKNIQMHRFNLRSNRVYDCDEDGNVLYEEDLPKMSIIENIRIFGGEVVFESERENATPEWDLNDEFIDDIEVMWHICSCNSPERATRNWDRQIVVFERIERIGGREGCLTSSAPWKELKESFGSYGKDKDNNYYLNRRIISELKKYGLIEINETEEEISVSYKNEQVKRCLTKAGQVLEMKIYLCALQTEKDGEFVYDDVMNGVTIDWDGDAEEDENIIKNEIDVIAMHRMIPVFISCKNGEVKIDELYKLDSVARRFGGKYSCKVMVISEIDKNPNEIYIRERADEMGIKIIDPIELKGEKLMKRIGNVWAN